MQTLIISLAYSIYISEILFFMSFNVKLKLYLYCHTPKVVKNEDFNLRRVWSAGLCNLL